MGPCGHDIDAPNLAALADEGLLLREDYCAGPACSPSRAVMMTGQRPHSNGVLGLVHRGLSLDDDAPPRRPPLRTRLRGGARRRATRGRAPGRGADRAARERLGYDRTLAGGETVDRDLPVDHEDTRRDLATTAAAASFLRDRGPAAAPFFLSVGLQNIHQPMPLEQGEVDPDRVRPPAPLPDVAPVREEHESRRT